MRIGLDVDGVICDFTHGAMQFCAEGLGITVPEADSWDWLKQHLTPEQHEYFWQRVQADTLEARLFWEMLPPTDWAMRLLNEVRTLEFLGHDVYWITSRQAARGKQHAEVWLRTHGFHGTVLRVGAEKEKGNKGRVAAALNLDLFVDDFIQECRGVIAYAPRCRVILLAAPYNGQEPLPHGVERQTGEWVVQLLKEVEHEG